MHWSDKYIGRGYIIGDYDCVNLAEEVLANEFNIEANFPKERDGESVFALSAQIDSVKDYYTEQINSPEEGSVVLMRARKRLNHVGVCFFINNEPYVLHNLRNIGQVCAHRIRDLHKHNLEVEGFYRLKHVSHSFTKSSIATA